MLLLVMTILRWGYEPTYNIWGPHIVLQWMMKWGISIGNRYGTGQMVGPLQSLGLSSWSYWGIPHWLTKPYVFEQSKTGHVVSNYAKAMKACSIDTYKYHQP